MAKVEYEQQREIIRKELSENTRYAPFWEKYGDKEKERFIDYFSQQKAFYVLYGKQYLEAQEQKDGKLIDLASDYLNIIQQKKLFNLQCLWRAEKIQIKEIDISFQFIAYGDNIEHCPFLEPITNNEVELLKSYVLNHADVMDRPKSGFWQHYPRLEEEGGYTNIEEDWYEYYDLHTGNTGLHLLPNIRGEKEDKYIKAAREAKKAKREQAGVNY